LSYSRCLHRTGGTSLPVIAMRDDLEVRLMLRREREVLTTRELHPRARRATYRPPAASHSCGEAHPTSSPASKRRTSSRSSSVGGFNRRYATPKPAIEYPGQTPTSPATSPHTQRRATSATNTLRLVRSHTLQSLRSSLDRGRGEVARKGPAILRSDQAGAEGETGVPAVRHRALPARSRQPHPKLRPPLEGCCAVARPSTDFRDKVLFAVEGVEVGASMAG